MSRTMRLPIKYSIPFSIALVVATFAIVPRVALAQGARCTVLVNGEAAGTATGVSHLPADTVIMLQHPDPNMPGEQAMSARRGSIIVTTADSALIAAMQVWMTADNAGFKDTVQRKSVAIDRVTGSGAITQFQLSNA